MTGAAGIVVRAAEPEDLPDLTALLNQPGVVRDTMQRPFTALATRRRWSEDWRPDLHIVAEVAGRVVGTLSLERFAERRAHAARLGMAVHDAHAGQGCGRALLAAALDHADRWTTLTRIELTVFVENARAIRLYERAGFKVEGRRRAFALRDGVFADVLEMARLKPG